MSKTEIELRQAAVDLLKIVTRDNENPTTAMLGAYVKTLDAIMASQSAEQREQDEERKS